MELSVPAPHKLNHIYVNERNIVNNTVYVECVDFEHPTPFEHNVLVDVEIMTETEPYDLVRELYNLQMLATRAHPLKTFVFTQIHVTGKPERFGFIATVTPVTRVMEFVPVNNGMTVEAINNAMKMTEKSDTVLSVTHAGQNGPLPGAASAAPDWSKVHQANGVEATTLPVQHKIVKVEVLPEQVRQGSVEFEIPAGNGNATSMMVPIWEAAKPEEKLKALYDMIDAVDAKSKGTPHVFYVVSVKGNDLKCGIVGSLTPLGRVAGWVPQYVIPR